MSCSHIHRLLKDCDWPRQEDYREVDIPAELQRVAREGLGVLGRATWISEWLRKPLLHITTMFTFMQAHHHAPWDDLEPCTAIALTQVDELLRQQTASEVPPLPEEAVELLKVLQRHAQDVVILAHSRFINQAILRGKGIPRELRDRLEASFGETAIADDALYSRLGNSKYQAFTKGDRFGDRKQRHRGIGGRRAAVRASLVEDLAEPCHIHLPEDRTTGTALSNIGHAIQAGAPAASSAAAAANSSAGSFSAASSWAAVPGAASSAAWKVEQVLQKHRVSYSMALIDDIVMSLS